MTTGLAEWLVNFIATYPLTVQVGVAVFVLSTLLVNGLRMAWKEEERPRWVKFLIGFLDIGALNFWRPVQSIKTALTPGGNP